METLSPRVVLLLLLEPVWLSRYSIHAYVRQTEDDYALEFSLTWLNPGL